MLRRDNQNGQQKALMQQQKQIEAEKTKMHTGAVAAAKKIPSGPNAKPQDLRKRSQGRG